VTISGRGDSGCSDEVGQLMSVPTVCYGKMISKFGDRGTAKLDDGQEIIVYNGLGSSVGIATRVLIMPAIVEGKEEWVIIAADCG
jgi:hypothetical protein